jgi:di/tricarboxylate transporter
VTAPPTAPTPPARARWIALLLATGALVAIVAAPTPGGLSVAGQRTLAVLAFAIVVWITEAVGYAISAALVVTLGALLLGFAPPFAPGAAGARLGTGRALGLFLEGFASPAAALVAAALFLAAAMRRTALDRRVALLVLRRTGTSPAASSRARCSSASCSPSSCPARRPASARSCPSWAAWSRRSGWRATAGWRPA